MTILRTCLCAMVALASACCPDARPARKTSRADSGDSMSVLAAALARAIERGNGPATAGDGERAAGDRGGPAADETRPGGKHKKGATDAPSGADGAEDHVPKPRITHEMLEKIKANATKAITSENADQTLEALRKELEAGGDPSASGANPSGEPAGDPDESVVPEANGEKPAVDGEKPVTHGEAPPADGEAPPADGEKPGDDGEPPADLPPADDGESSGGE